MTPLVPLPPHPEDVPWPTGGHGWPTGSTPLPVVELVDDAFTDPALADTYAVVVVQGGRLVAERYAGELEHWDRPNEPVGPGTRLLSWSMAKSVLQAAVGILVGDGRLRTTDRADVPAWDDEGDPRSAITLDHLLPMRDGLDFAEDYVDAERSDVIEMLFGAGEADVAAFAADRALAAPPGERFNYSSGTSNIVSGIVARAVGPGPAYEAFLAERLFEPLGMASAQPRCDGAGTWVASSYLYATARDFARFGLLYLRGGVWDGRRLLPEGWVDEARCPRSADAEGNQYGSHWWVEGGHGGFRAAGHEGQSILVVPGLDLVLVRMGKTPAERDEDLGRWRARVVAAVGTA